MGFKINSIMSRTTNRIRLTPKVIIGLILAICFIPTIVIISSQDRFSNLPAFPEEGYLNDDNLWGNTAYLLKGTFQNILIPPSASGAVLCSVVSDEKGNVLPLIIPEKAAKHTYQREQKIKLKVYLDQQGRIIAQDSEVQ